MGVHRALAALAAVAILPAAALAASDGDDALRLAQLLAAPIGHADVLLHALPKDLPSAIPLPSASLVGSVEQHVTSGGSYGGASLVAQSGPPMTLYYDVAGDRAAAVSAYETRLRGSGWKGADLSRTFPFTQGGFTMQLPQRSTWCSAEKPPTVLTITTPGEDAKALTVSIVSGSPTRIYCGGGTEAGMEAFSFMMALKSPLPTFSAPPGILMSGAGPAGGGWTSGARLQTSLALPAVFEAFAKQLRDGGWNPGEVTSGSAVRSQTFRKTVDGKGYVALLTVYVLDATHDVALADVTLAGP